MKNGLIWKVAIPVAIFIAGYGALQAQVGHTKEEVEKLEEEHNEDVKGINGKLETITNLMHEQAVANGKMQANLEHIGEDIKELKAR